MRSTLFAVALLALQAWGQLADSVPDEEPSARPRGLLVRETGTSPGYTLISPLTSRQVYLLNTAGSVVHEWSTGHTPGAAVYLLDDGTLLRCAREEDNAFRGGGIGGRIQRLDKDGALLWDYDLSDATRSQHHDIEPLPNGNVLAIVWERVPPGVAEAAGRDPETLGKDGVWPGAVLEIRPLPPTGGEVVWEWHAWDHLVQDRLPGAPHHGVVAEHPGRIDVNAGVRPGDEPTGPELDAQMRALGYVGGGREADADDDAPARPNVDWLHLNSVSYQPELELILLSTPRLNEIWVIDHSTTTEEARGSTGGRYGKGGDLLYRWGNPAMRGVPAAGRQLYAQHDARWIDGPDGSPRVLLFNNGLHRPGGEPPRSTVEELVLPFDPEQGFVRSADGTFGPASPDWIFGETPTLYSGILSGAQRLPNGNTLICSGASGRLIEVTRDGRIVWDYWNTHGVPRDERDEPGRTPTYALFRGTRIPPGHPGLVRLLAR